MAAIATRSAKLGNLIKSEYGTEHGYCREMKTVTLTPTSEIGDVLYDVTGDLALVNQINTASAEAVLVDADITELRPATGTAVVSCAVLVRGPAVVADTALNYNADIDTDNEKAALYAVLEALGILVRTQV